MNEDTKISLFCEGDLNCPNNVSLTQDEVLEKNKKDESILCDICKPKYGHLTSTENRSIGWKDI